MEELRKIDPIYADESINELARACPDAASYFVEFTMAEVLARKVLDSKTKALVVLASLVGFGRCEGFFRTHVLGALHAGCTREEIFEVAILNGVITGSPNMLLAVKHISEAFASVAPTGDQDGMPSVAKDKKTQ
ncbi:MAG: carboxymuconolactone decarboxylase family protein [Verrucomicrobium sp.]|nr:carboxymuconolactone decarboxylase family protein [Verrucomicrobium sp.]